MSTCLKYLEQLAPLYGKDHARTALGWLYHKATSKELMPLEWNITSSQQQQIEKWITMLVHDHYPLQYILETVPFGNITIHVQEPVLIPRPETEEWVYNVLYSLREYKDKPLRILDMCTGSGCIALAVAEYFRNAHVDAVDLYTEPLELTQKNILFNNLDNVSVIQSDLFENLQGKTYDLIFSNPPYIDESVWQTLSPTVKEWEDKRALVADNKGLALYEQMIAQLPQFLTKNSIIQNAPRVYLEIGYDQGEKVKVLLEEAKFKNVDIHQDFAGHNRMVSAY